MRAPPYSTNPADLFSADSIENPHSLYAKLRQGHPISRVGETGIHLVATWDLVDEALQREGDFSSHLTGVLVRGEDGDPTVFDLPDAGANHVIATADEPDHAVHRALTQPKLTARRIATLEPRVRLWTREALAPWLAVGGGDFVPIAEGIPARAVAHVLGLPDGDVSRHRKWAMTGGDMLAGDVGHRQLVALAEETLRMAEYLGSHLEEARRETRVDADAPLLHALARGLTGGDLRIDQAIGIAIIMVGAGGESTAALLGSAIYRLASDPPLADQLRQTPGRIPRFVEEVARLEPPFKFHYRVVRRACELGGAKLSAGDRLMLLWASANRDATHFEAPDELRLDRRHPKDHMSFGRGNHFCIGAPLARLEARVVVEEVLTRTRKISLRPPDPVVYAHSIFVRRPERVTVDVQAV